MGLRMWFLENEEDSAKDLQAVFNSLSEDEQEFFEERAAIMEYDGELSRGDAEKEAHKLTLIFFGRNRINKFL